ncbi:hypothetical protein ACFU6M_06100 [Streptomyces bottropensis]|uniref:hypothetical protein n=1 Tax=Streptomyces bottropensis TaxID=42235 RepID=UPI0036C3BF38
MLNLLMTPRAVRNIRGLLGTVSAAVRSVVAPATLVEHTEAPALAADPADTYTADEMPELVAIERAALGYDLAADNARRADRAKRAARKILDRLPAGTYGNWIVERVASSRQTADLDQIRAIFKANGLGPVPMKSNAPSLKVSRAELGAPVDADTPVLATV